MDHLVEQPVIYTDRSSLRQHYRTIQRTLAGVLPVELIIGVFNLSNVWNRTADYLFTGRFASPEQNSPANV